MIYVNIYLMDQITVYYSYMVRDSKVRLAQKEEGKNEEEFLFLFVSYQEQNKQRQNITLDCRVVES